ncbi:MAG: lipid carrier--UDP-N-acetylgalactosaminyltransferase [Caulobacteraceae bacterium]|nr:lipid carrier--UDP-N-acetylgalactosaminyltransferase [Caulobacteraceae bacterium]
MTVAGHTFDSRPVTNTSYLPVKRGLDILTSAIGLAIFAIPMLVIAVLIRLDSPGPALYWSRRAGLDGRAFDMPKFRSMRIETPTVSSRGLENPEAWVTRMGRFLRRTSLDELPQLWSVFSGKMSFIGPRAILLEETDLLAARSGASVDILRPGITGWAQVNGRDHLSIDEKVALDREYLKHCSISFDVMITLKTVKRVILCADVSH